mgnify:CR=1 FL=1
MEQNFWKKSQDLQMKYIPLLIFGAYNPQDDIHLDLITNDIDDES